MHLEILLSGFTKKKEGCQLGGVGQPDFTVGGQLLSQQQRNSNDNKMFALLQ